MKKILITGIVASGKTTLAKNLSQKLNIPHYELDYIAHKKIGRQTEEQQIKEILEIDKTGMWIFEGTNRKQHICLLDMADTIIFIDPPLYKRKFRIFSRFIKQKLGLEKSQYKPSLIMLKKMYMWTNEFERDREKFEAILKQYEKKLIILSDYNFLEIFSTRPTTE